MKPITLSELQMTPSFSLNEALPLAAARGERKPVIGFCRASFYRYERESGAESMSARHTFSPVVIGSLCTLLEV